MTARPTLLFYCQHSLGLGHLVRSLLLAAGLAERFTVVLLNGGRLPAGTRAPAGVQIVNLPPLGYDERFRLVSHDQRYTVQEAQVERRRVILRTLTETAPRVVLVELYPFGRKKFEFELVPLLEAVVAQGADRPKVVCSVRDILVGSAHEQPAYDNRCSERANQWFDAILVHADPTFARFEDSFRPEVPLRVPVRYTGFVAPPSPAIADPAGPALPRLLVSAGGGMVGEPLFRAVVDVHTALAERTGLHTTVVAGPFLPDPAWQWLQSQADRSPHLDAVRRVDNLCAEMRRSALSLSQGGYNTTMDILRASTPTVVVPFADGGEDEQSQRAQRLAEMGLLRLLPGPGIDRDALLTQLCDAVSFRPRPVRLDLSGQESSARIVSGIAGLTADVLPELEPVR